MHLFLLTPKKLYNYVLPKDVFGSYGFYLDSENNNNLINIEAKDNKWYLCSTKKVTVFSNNNPVETIQLEHNKMYNIRTNNNNTYIIYAKDDDLNNNYYYKFEMLNLLIGNHQSSNVKYSQAFYNDFNVKIYTNNNTIFIDPNGVLCYINGNVIKNQKQALMNGDKIWIFGLELILLNNRVVINSPYTEDSSINLSSTGLTKPYIEYDKEYVEEELTDFKIFRKDDYFIKSPKIRRTYNKKKIKIEAYPTKNDFNDTPAILTFGPMLTMGMTSMVLIAQTISKLYVGETTLEKSWPMLIMSCTMLISMLVWPMIISSYRRRSENKKYERECQKYDQYLKDLEKELSEEVILQKKCVD